MEGKIAPLKVEIVNDVLTISIGIGTLVHAVFYNPNKNYTEEFVVEDLTEFAKDIFIELNEEDEQGTTLVHTLFIDAAETAINNGSCSLLFLPPFERRNNIEFRYVK